jgi:hypothetical protein
MHCDRVPATALQVFESGSLETRVPLTTRSGTKDAGEIWITLRSEGGNLVRPRLRDGLAY